MTMRGNIKMTVNAQNNAILISEEFMAAVVDAYTTLMRSTGYALNKNQWFGFDENLIVMSGRTEDGKEDISQDEFNQIVRLSVKNIIVVCNVTRRNITLR